ncbi:CAP domain-containing protein [Thermoclostridium stercorarium]|uniref:CAP domain-containing protein n=1 Tax=Thermoclostridium stercorarium TaxID=1510 RepID=UPI00224898D0|nr:CAP domain-containing protein [Thermoclostridium stercorarium]UZQ85312.1 CAP domain-containing protein [Thermoclostridium stercorarium]
MKRKVLAVLLLTFLFTGVFGMLSRDMTPANAEMTWKRVDFISGIVTAYELNVRKGPSTKYQIIGTLKKNQWVNVLAEIDGWYVIFEPNTGLVGCVSSKYLQPPHKVNQTPDTGTSTPKATATPTPTPVPSSVTLSKDEQELLDLINAERAKAGLVALKADPELMEVARLKAKDMVENNYFSHQSPKYGSPFDMMRQFGISFKSAGENIAGNSTEEGAVKAWMNSEGHRKNILNGNFNYTGIGIYQSPKYGKIFVQMFIGR